MTDKLRNNFIYLASMKEISEFQDLLDVNNENTIMGWVEKDYPNEVDSGWVSYDKLLDQYVIANTKPTEFLTLKDF